MEFYSGKVVLITGASSGLGLATIGLLLSVPDVTILATSRSKSKLAKLVESTWSSVNNVKCVELDLESTDEAIENSIKMAHSIAGRIDVLFNCAGMGFRGEVRETLLSVDRRVMQVDYFGQVAIIKALTNIWGQHSVEAGLILQVSSVQGYFGLGGRAPYSAAKHALVGFIDSFRVEFDTFPKRSRFQVSLVSPGYIATNHSVNSITGDGSAYSKADESTQSGYSPEYVAEQALVRASRGERDIVIADSKVRLFIIIRALFANLCFRILRMRYIGERESFFKSVWKWIFGLP